MDSQQPSACKHLEDAHEPQKIVTLPHKLSDCSAVQVMGLAKLGVGIAASDETSIDTAVLTFKGYTKEVKGMISQYNTHSVRPIFPTLVISAQ